MNYFEYCTLEDFRAAKLPKQPELVVGAGDGTLIRDYIRDVSRDINRLTGRYFAPIIATRYFDAEQDVGDDGLLLRLTPFDLLAVGTITNGDATAVTADQYVYEPRNNPPYWALRLLSSVGVTWTYENDEENAITLAGCTWGYHDDYASAWEQVDTLGAALTNSATSATLTTGAGNPGELWKIGSEFCYLSARASKTATIVRGVNGSTAAAHDNGAVIYRWLPLHEIRDLTIAAASIKYAIRENPQIEQITVDNHVVSVPKDIGSFIRREVERLGLVRL